MFAGSIRMERMGCVLFKPKLQICTEVNCRREHKSERSGLRSRRHAALTARSGSRCSPFMTSRSARNVPDPWLRSPAQPRDALRAISGRDPAYSAARAGTGSGDASPADASIASPLSERLPVRGWRMLPLRRVTLDVCQCSCSGSIVLCASKTSRETTLASKEWSDFSGRSMAGDYQVRGCFDWRRLLGLARSC